MCSCVFVFAHVGEVGIIKIWIYCFHEVRAGKVRAGNGKRVFSYFQIFRITVIPTLFPLAVCCIFCSAGCTLPAQKAPSPTAKGTV